ncbi:MAG: pyridoxamine 5'-phosphate oxidase family protein [Fusobacteriaceae bacterium]|jgi:nitroimidazol reductase NimA-like FMN-containing flavoprotein (pyridoxamine 5'-phosphate oxidase superfamily)|nr:pyridoxamine 5'-phosphate oxidase family protein [Fusobacteriaceae bacterium]
MRRADREITSIEEKLIIISECKVCRIGISINDQPYVIPLNFGYDYKNNQLILYFHSAKEGKKIDILSQNNKSCFEVDCDHKLIEGKVACDYGFAFTSVIGFGKIEFIEDRDEKVYALNMLMKHQTDCDTEYEYEDKRLNAIAVYKLIVEEFTGKHKAIPPKM